MSCTCSFFWQLQSQRHWQISVSQSVDHCDVPSGAAPRVPWQQCQTVRPFAVVTDQPVWFLHARNAGSSQSAPYKDIYLFIYLFTSLLEIWSMKPVGLGCPSTTQRSVSGSYSWTLTEDWGSVMNDGLTPPIIILESSSAAAWRLRTSLDCSHSTNSRLGPTTRIIACLHD